MTHYYPEELAEMVRNAREVQARWEPVDGRYVRCDQDDWRECERGKFPDVFYALSEGGGHGHYERYDAPHRRLVIRLPAEPGDADA